MSQGEFPPFLLRATAIAPTHRVPSLRGYRARPRGLLDTKQLLGCLPTWRFWDQPDHLRLVQPFLGAASAVIIVGAALVSAVTFGLGSALLAGAVVGALSPTLALGLVERHVRRRLRDRRERRRLSD